MEKAKYPCLIVNIISIGSFFETGTWIEPAFYKMIPPKDVFFLFPNIRNCSDLLLFSSNGTRLLGVAEKRKCKANDQIFLCTLANISVGNVTRYIFTFTQHMFKCDIQMFAGGMQPCWSEDDVMANGDILDVMDQMLEL